MCEPVSMGIFSVLSTTMSIVSQNQQIAAQNQQNAAMRQAADNNARLEYDAASNAAAIDYQAVGQQQSQVNAQAAQEQQQRALQAMRERAALRVSAGEAGVAGNSIDRLEGDTFMSEARDMSTIETNRVNKITQAQLTKKGVEATAQGRINSGISAQNATYAQTRKKDFANPLLSGLQIGAAGVNGYMQGAYYKKQLG